MKCFYHHDADAIGSCKACSKGLCSICAVDVGQGLACRDICEDQVRRLNQLIERNIRMSPASEQILGKHPRAYVGNGIFAIVAGAVFGFMGQSLDGAFRLGVVAIGVLVAVFGVWQIAYAWALRRATDRL